MQLNSLLSVIKNSFFFLSFVFVAACAGMGGGGVTPPGGQGLQQAATPTGTFNPHGDEAPLGGAGNHSYRCSYAKEGSSHESKSDHSSFFSKFSKEFLDDPTDFPISFEEPLALRLFIDKITIKVIKPVQVSKLDSDPPPPNSVAHVEGPIVSLTGTINSLAETYVRIIFAPEGKPPTSYLYQDAVMEGDSGMAKDQVEFSNLNIKEKGELSVYVTLYGKPDLFHPEGFLAFPNEEAYKAFTHSTMERPNDYLGKFSIHEKKHEE